MRAMIRWAACLVAVGAAAAAFAVDPIAAAEDEEQQATPAVAKDHFDAEADAAEAGAASGEPALMDQKAAMDARAAREESSRNEDEQRFVEQTWSGP